MAIKNPQKEHQLFLIKDLYFYFELIHGFASTEMVFDKYISGLMYVYHKSERTDAALASLYSYPRDSNPREAI